MENSHSNEIIPIKSAFGAVNRARLINSYFADQSDEIASSSAWKHVYQLLLCTDQTTGLGHCYESDKSQPGKRWYARSLAFHDWLSDSLSVTPAELSKSIDWLFLRAAEDLAAYVLKQAAGDKRKAEAQRKPYAGRGFPEPGEDPEFVSLVSEIFNAYFHAEPPTELWNIFVQRSRQYLALSNKRKNLVGEGFEDVIAQVIERSCQRSDMKVYTRKGLHEIPGFNRARSGDKVNKVDVAILRPSMRTLITAKWSVRADREKQFVTDLTDYLAAESDRKPFEYVFVTNEFDPARLMRACEQLNGNSHMFTHVVHISTDAIKATYGVSASELGEMASMQRVLSHIENGRLISLEKWLDLLKDSNAL